ncbi:hypothetical protein V8C86DRAFT_3030172, partial [Haematococcus lacustris]
MTQQQQQEQQEQQQEQQQEGGLVRSPRVSASPRGTSSVVTVELDTLALCAACLAVWWPGQDWQLLSAALALVCQPAWSALINGGPYRALLGFVTREMAVCHKRSGAPLPSAGAQLLQPYVTLACEPLLEVLATAGSATPCSELKPDADSAAPSSLAHPVVDHGSHPSHPVGGLGAG